MDIIRRYEIIHGIWIQEENWRNLTKLSQILKKEEISDKGRKYLHKSICKSHIKGLISKIYKELFTLNSKKTKNPIRKLTKEFNRHCNRHNQQKNIWNNVKTSLTIRAMKLKHYEIL